MKKITQFLLVTVAFLFTTVAFAQGVTTSSLGGQVTDAQGEPLPGATVIAVHTPTGSKYGAATDFDGYYRISNMRTGGPYTVTISYVGFKEFVRENVYLQLGNSERISTQLSEDASVLDEVVITADRTGIFDSNKTGASTNISNRQIQTLPQTSRSIADFVRITPQAQLTEGNDGFSISLAGQNNRYNAIYVDGAVNNDVFGLAGSGTNGGQTGVNPFSVDAIESFTVQLAPFDVKISGFAGGAISAVTRSGSNVWSGSVYGFLRNEDLAGKTPVDLVGTGETREKLDEFTAQTYGFRVGGPIIKDKLFFFLNYERQDDETPQPFNFSNYTGDSSLAEINALASSIASQYGYDVGGFENNTRTLESDKLTLKLDWNIDDKNKLSFSTRYAAAENLEARASGDTRIAFINGSEFFDTKTLSGSLEWNYQGNNISNNMLLGYTRVRDDRDPLGNPFPSVDIDDGAGTITFGAEPFSTANLLDQDVLTFTNNFEIYKGAHTITLGTHNEFAKIKNLFFAFNFGDYTFNSVSDFNNDIVDFYQHGYSLVGNGVVGDESAGASEFNTTQLGFYAQDEVQISDNFKFTAGLRFDFPIWEDGTVNDDFNNRTIPLLEAAGKDLQGARVGKGVRTRAHVSPRLGFNWDVKGNRTTQVRGGLGIFTSRLPLVWPGATYNNNGVTGGFSTNFDISGGVNFNPDVNSQPVDVVPGSGGTGGNIDLFTPDFKLPQRFKVNLAVDQKLPIWGLIASVDAFWIDNITEIFYQNLNVGGPVGFLNGADGRPFYDRRDEVDPTYGRIMLASNTGAGDSWNTTFSLRKPYTNVTDWLALEGALNYSYGETTAIFDGTSSQNSSQWRNLQTVNGKNSNLPVTRSDFNQGHRITSSLGLNINWNENVQTKIGLFYEGAEAQPYSFTYRDGADLLNDDSRDNALIYVPANASEITLEDSNSSGSTNDEWATLDGIISGNSYLNSRRGQYAERNGVQGPWSHVIDLRLAQNFSVNAFGKKHTFEATFDIFNFTNFINKEWGNRNFASQNVQILQTVTAGPDPVFRVLDSGINNIERVDDRGLQSSRWQMQVGLRYSF
ncbi:MAG: TonB-dependent receptor [Winogradskyella sp.]|uniref:TonB-dependent receptor n=1 Tax=Winogradskyella sp. TaxID=1883156 RepID=UPI000F3BC67E|nr:TonB-dependent receptor [Winogradskyella sp.]RNC88418.1 MAG: TonB-dependent receptor [Winogradskyella sp.]